MTSPVGHHGGGSKLCLNQDFVKNKAAGEKGRRLPALFQVLSSTSFRWLLPFLCTMALMLTFAHGEEQTRFCSLMDPAILWDFSSVVNFEMISLCPHSSTNHLPIQHMDICIPHVHINAENHSPARWAHLTPSRTNVKVVMTVLAILGGIGLAGWMLYNRRQTFTDADINMGLTSEPATLTRSNLASEILPCIE